MHVRAMAEAPPWTVLNDCTWCISVVMDQSGHIPTVTLEQARMSQTPLCRISTGHGPCSQPLEDECPESTSLCVWAAPPSPPPPPPSPPPHPPTAPKVTLHANGAFGEVSVYHINNGSSYSIAEFVAAEAMHGSEHNISMLYLAFLSSLATCGLVALWMCLLSCFRCTSEHWTIYKITTRSGLSRLPSTADTEVDPLPAFDLPAVSAQRVLVLMICKGCAIVSALVLLCAPRGSTAWEDEVSAAQHQCWEEVEEASGRAKSHRLRSADCPGDEPDAINAAATVAPTELTEEEEVEEDEDGVKKPGESARAPATDTGRMQPKRQPEPPDLQLPYLPPPPGDRPKVARATMIHSSNPAPTAAGTPRNEEEGEGESSDEEDGEDTEEEEDEADDEEEDEADDDEEEEDDDSDGEEDGEDDDEDEDEDNGEEDEDEESDGEEGDDDDDDDEEDEECRKENDDKSKARNAPGSGKAK